MNWNNNDTKYILKRIITYFLISAIIFFIGQRCAKATVISTQIANAQNITATSTQGSTYLYLPNCSNCGTMAGGVFKNSGEGYVIFTLYVAPGATQNQQDPLTWVAVGNSSSKYMCETSQSTWYYDNTTQRLVNSYKCPVNIDAQGLTYIEVYNREARLLFIQESQYMTFSGGTTDASAIVNGINQAINNQTSQGSANTQAIVDSVNGMIYYSNQNANQAHLDSQAQINSINTITNTINSDYNSNTGTGFLNAFDNIFTQEDENVIRQFVMIPFNLYILLYNSITNGSCQSISLGTLYGVDLELPCINYRNIIGVPLYTTIDTIFGACLLFGIIRMIKKFFNSLFSVSSKATDENGIEVFK